VINIELPPLRERLADIPLLAQHFLTRTCEEAGKQPGTFHDDALAALARYNWPGNVRELQNAVERAVLLSRGSEIGVEDLFWIALRHNLSAKLTRPRSDVHQVVGR